MSDEKWSLLLRHIMIKHTSCRPNINPHPCTHREFRVLFYRHHPKSATQIRHDTWRPPRPWGRRQGSPRGAAARRPAPRAGSHGGDEQRRFRREGFVKQVLAKKSEVGVRNGWHAQAGALEEGPLWWRERNCVLAVSTVWLTGCAANRTTSRRASPTRRASSSRPGSAHMRRASPSTLWRRSSPRTRIRTPRGGERTLRLPRKS